VQWFREACVKLEIDGRIAVTDANAAAPALSDADLAAVVPPIADERYPEAMAGLCERWGVDLAISLNDYELSTWTGAMDSVFASLGVRVLGVRPRAQRVVEDKFLYSSFFQTHGLDVPRTWLGSEVVSQDPRAETGEDAFVIKNRFGSGSAGLRRTTRTRLRADVISSARTATNRDGTAPRDGENALELIVVQPLVLGREYGVDVINDFEGNFAGALAREKLRMRSGETDQAVSVPSSGFQEAAARLSSAIGHTGLVDVDVILDQEGRQWLIDVNPRFGGGYPFSHLAGADVPACYLAWHLGRTVNPDWIRCTPGVTSAKTEAIRTVLARADWDFRAGAV